MNIGDLRIDNPWWLLLLRLVTGLLLKKSRPNSM